MISHCNIHECTSVISTFTVNIKRKLLFLKGMVQYSQLVIWYEYTYFYNSSMIWKCLEIYSVVVHECPYSQAFTLICWFKKTGNEEKVSSQSQTFSCEWFIDYIHDVHFNCKYFWLAIYGS